jgi:hypothetical protein
VCSVRESVDVAALSQLVQGNMRNEDGGNHDAAATECDVALRTADAEVQFRMQAEGEQEGVT